jgi:hypothetical protein
MTLTTPQAHLQLQKALLLYRLEAKHFGHGTFSPTLRSPISLPAMSMQRCFRVAISQAAAGVIIPRT